MTVAINNLQNKSAISELGENDTLYLCYEVHGQAGATFNLVSDTCVSVNAHYRQVRANESINVIDAVYIRAVDRAGRCHNISVDLDGCSASIDGESISSMFSQAGVSVHPYTNHVRVDAFNCDNLATSLELFMWVNCQNETFQSDLSRPETSFDAEMITFEISRASNLQETAHGLLGQ